LEVTSISLRSHGISIQMGQATIKERCIELKEWTEKELNKAAVDL
jgi:hypothetical protein